MLNFAPPMTTKDVSDGRKLLRVILIRAILANPKYGSRDKSCITEGLQILQGVQVDTSRFERIWEVV